MADKKKDADDAPKVTIDSRATDNVIEAKKRDLEEEIAKRDSRTIAEFPKWITDPNDPSKGFTVNDADQEARVRKGLGMAGEDGRGVQGGATFDKTAEELEAERLAKFEADKEAAKGKSRLDGPENPPEASNAPKADKSADKSFAARAKDAVLRKK